MAWITARSSLVRCRRSFEPLNWNGRRWRCEERKCLRWGRYVSFFYECITRSCAYFKEFSRLEHRGVSLTASSFLLFLRDMQTSARLRWFWILKLFDKGSGGVRYGNLIAYRRLFSSLLGKTRTSEQFDFFPTSILSYRNVFLTHEFVFNQWVKVFASFFFLLFFFLIRDASPRYIFILSYFEFTCFFSFYNSTLFPFIIPEIFSHPTM